MRTRFLMKLMLVFSLSVIPLATWADDVPAPATTDQTAQTAPGVAPSSSLGPQQGASGTGSSSTDFSALQPAGTSPLQPTGDASSGASGASASPLQASATPGDALKVIASEVDGAPSSPQDQNPTVWPVILIALLLVSLVGSGYFVLLRHEQRAGY